MSCNPVGKSIQLRASEDDFYPTPRGGTAVDPLPRGVRTFAEPCAGDGDLVRHLDVRPALRLSGDISTGQDALALDNYGTADAIITNPPYSRRTRCCGAG